MGAKIGRNYKYNVADKTVTLQVDPDTGEERLFQISDSTVLTPNGYIVYKTVRVMSLKNIQYPPGLDEYEKYDYLKRHMSELEYDAPIVSYVEIKDGRGVLRIIIDGFTQEEIGSNGFVKDTGRGTYIHFMNYKLVLSLAQLFHENIATDTDGYVMQEGELDQSKYSENERVTALGNVKFGTETASANPTDEDIVNYYIHYTASDETDIRSEIDDPEKEKLKKDPMINFARNPFGPENGTLDRRQGGSLTELAINPFGLPYFDKFKGMPGEPDSIKLFYNAEALPAYVEGDTDGKKELLGTFERATVHIGDDRYLATVENDPAPTVIGKVLYSNPVSWKVYKNGVFLARKMLTELKTEEYNGIFSPRDNTANNLSNKIINLFTWGHGPKEPEVREALKVLEIAQRDKGFREVPAPEELKETASSFPRYQRFLQTSQWVGIALAGLLALVMFLWKAIGWTVRPINVNVATFEELLQIFTREEASRIIGLRNETGPFKSSGEIKALLRTTPFEDISSKITILNPEGAQVSAVQALAKDYLNSPVLTASVLAHIKNFIALKLLEEDEVRRLVQETTEPLLTNGRAANARVSVDAYNLNKRLLRNLFVAAYWEKDGRMKATSKSSLRTEIETIFNRVGLSPTEFDNRRYIEYSLMDIGQMVPSDIVTPAPVEEAGAPSIGRPFYILDHDLGWKAMRLEDYVIQNVVMPRLVPFINTNMAVQKYYAMQVKQMIAEGKTAEQIKTFLKRQELFWYQVLKDQMAVKLEGNRNLRAEGKIYANKRLKKWEFLVTWEEWNDAFRYLMDESDIEPDRRLPEWIRGRKDFAANKTKMLELLRRINDGEFQSGDQKTERNNLKSDQIQELVKNHVEDLVSGVRKAYGIPSKTPKEASSKVLPS
jgi:hypothetical protein